MDLAWIGTRKIRDLKDLDIKILEIKQLLNLVIFVFCYISSGLNHDEMNWRSAQGWKSQELDVDFACKYPTLAERATWSTLLANGAEVRGFPSWASDAKDREFDGGRSENFGRHASRSRNHKAAVSSASR